MKIILSIVCFVNLTVFGFSIRDFVVIRNYSPNLFKDVLDENNWFLYDEDEQRKGDIIMYQYKHKNDIKSTLGIQWINHVHRPKLINKNRLSFQVQNIILFEQYIKELRDTLNFKVIGEKIVDNNIMVLYSDGTVTVEVITSQNKYLYDGQKYYNFAFYDAMEYEAIFLNNKNEPLNNKLFVSSLSIN